VPCGSDLLGPCTCVDAHCFTHGFARSATSCEQCDPGWRCSDAGGGLFECIPPCGDRSICAGDDFCRFGGDSCGRGGLCFWPLGGNAGRCGATAGPDSCGCAGDADCASFGAGAFCVQITGPNCGCPGNATTFCALPR